MGDHLTVLEGDGGASRWKVRARGGRTGFVSTSAIGDESQPRISGAAGTKRMASCCRLCRPANFGP